MKLGTTRWTLERTSGQSPAAEAALARCVVPMYRIVRKLNEGTETALQPFGLSQTEFEILQTLALGNPDETFTLTDLNRALLFSSGGITKIVERLQRSELLAIETDPADRRRRLCRLTPQGRRLVRRALKAVVSHEQQIIEAHTSAVERRALAGVLRRITDGFERNGAD